MLLPVDLMSIVSAGSPSAAARHDGATDNSAHGSWLLAANSDTSQSDTNEMINRLFLSYANADDDGSAARFAADLKSLLSAHGVSFTSEQPSLILTGTHQNLELSDLDWSVDELLQMSMSPLAGGKPLPPGDQTLPVEIANWLASLMAKTDPRATSVPANSAVTFPGGSNQLASVAANSLASDTTTSGGESDNSVLTQTTLSGASLNGGNNKSPGLNDPTMTGGSNGVEADTDALVPTAYGRSTDYGVAGLGLELTVQSQSFADLTRQASQVALINPDNHKFASDAVNASAFRSINFNQPGFSNTGSVSESVPAILSDPIRTSLPLERNQSIASQLSASLSAAVNTETSAAGNSPQLFNPADGSAFMNRAEQRMFATESAQQAQAQAAQQATARSAEGLPRFAMDTAFGQQGWSDSLGRQLLVMSTQGVTSAQIRLDPPELGSLTVKIQVAADQQTSVSFVSQHALVREALEQQLNRLQDLFRDQGLNLQDVTVSDQSAQQRGEGSGGQQGQGEDRSSTEQESAETETVMMHSESLIDFYA